MGLEGGNDLLVGVTGLAGFLVLLAGNLGLVAFDGWFGGKAVTRGFSQQLQVGFNLKGGFRDLNTLRDDDLNPIR